MVILCTQILDIVIVNSPISRLKEIAIRESSTKIQRTTKIEERLIIKPSKYLFDERQNQVVALKDHWVEQVCVSNTKGREKKMKLN